MLAFVSLGLTGPVMSLYLQSLGASTVIIGLMFAVFGIGEGIFGFVWGTAADRIGIGMPLLVQMFVGAACLIAFGGVTALAVLFVLRFVLAAVGAAMYPIGRGFLANAVPPERKGTAMALFAVMSSAGMSIGSAVSGALAAALGYPAVFYAAAALIAVAGLVVLVELRNETIAHKPDALSMVPVMPTRSSARPLFVLSLITALGTAASSSGITFTPLLMTDYAGVPVADVGYAYGIAGLVGIFLVLFSGGLSDRVGRKPILVLGLSMMLPGLIGLAFTRSYWPIVVCILLAQLGFAITFPPILTLMSNVTPQRYQGRSQGIFVVAIDVGIVIGPVITGWVWSAAGPTPAYLFGAVLIAITCAVTVIFVQEQRWTHVHSRVLAASAAVDV